MNKKGFNLLLYLGVILFITFIALNNKAHDEQDIFLSTIKYLKQDDDISPSAIYSYPSFCHRTDSPKGEYSAELWNDFLKVNKYENGPIQIFSLKGIANTVKWEDNLQIYDTEEGSLRFRSTDKILVKLSRVGFNKDKSEALICVEPGGVATLIHLIKQNNSWVVLAQNDKWVH